MDENIKEWMGILKLLPLIAVTTCGLAAIAAAAFRVFVLIAGK